MTTFQGILLGVIQGIAEFLPISSSGHLKLAQILLGLNDVPLLFDVFLHVATLCAVLLYFRRIIGRLISVLFRWIFRRPLPRHTSAVAEKQDRRMILTIIITTAVTGVIGFVTSKFIPELSIYATCIGFLFTAAILIGSAVTDKLISLHYAASSGVRGDRPFTGVRWWQALIIGFAQGIGTLPGVSRSGSTIAGALFSGVDRVSAGEYSFIVSIPAILGAFILELKDLDAVAGSIGASPVIAGCAAAFAAGYLALTWLMRLIRKGRLEWFAAYLIPLGVLGLIFL
ncbi:MAG: undecaprenyl-diphosphate phosphatase [Treponema sp.]|nr:undecaprenyl-diphosphate phosphatase [Treponema sp.]